MMKRRMGSVIRLSGETLPKVVIYLVLLAVIPTCLAGDRESKTTDANSPLKNRPVRTG